MHAKSDSYTLSGRSAALPYPKHGRRRLPAPMRSSCIVQIPSQSNLITGSENQNTSHPGFLSRVHPFLRAALPTPEYLPLKSSPPSSPMISRFKSELPLCCHTARDKAHPLHKEEAGWWFTSRQIKHHEYTCSISSRLRVGAPRGEKKCTW